MSTFLNPFQMNQFQPQPLAGTISSLGLSTVTRPCRIAQAQGSSVAASMAVTLADTASGIAEVVAATSSTDKIYGFIAYAKVQNVYSAGQVVPVAQLGCQMWMVAKQAISVGQELEYDPVTGKVVPHTSGSNTVIGLAESKAVNPNDLVRVHIMVPTIFPEFSV